MIFHYIYAGVHWEFDCTAIDKGACVGNQAELWLDVDPILQNVDEWASEVGTAYPFTVDGVRDWWEEEGIVEPIFQRAAIEHADDARADA